MKKAFLSTVLTLCIILSSITAGGFSVFAVTRDTESSGASVTAETTSANAYGLVDNVQQGQILQCWNWSYNGIKSNMQKIAEQGFSAIQTSPIQTIKESTQGKSFSTNWWVYYQPSDFNIDTSSQNALGTKAEFKAMCDEAHKYGVKVIVDAVLNHMANNGDNTLSSTIPSDIRNDSSCWHSITTNTSNWDSRWDITHNCMGGLPDLNTGNSKIQNYEKAFMKECIDAGADGFRFDGAKHIELPNDYENASSNFWTVILNYTTSYAQSSRGFTPYYYGEILDKPAGGQSIVNGYTNLMSVTANMVSDDIRNKVNSGNASGAKRTDFCYNDGSQPVASKAVLWNESHDTYANGASRGMSDNVMNKTWALVGSRAEACGMYLARPSNYSQKIGTASVTAWANKEVQAVNQFKNYFVGQSEYMSASGSIAYNERGTEGVVLVNCSGGSTSVSVKANKMKDGTYEDQVSGNTFTVSGGQIKGQIGSTGIAVVYNAVATPVASVSPDSKNYKTDTLELKLSYENATSGQYSIDGGAYNSFTSGQTITIGAGLPYGTKTTVSVKASDGSTTSEPVSYTYTKVDPSAVRVIDFSNKQTVYLWNTASWGTQNCYSWPTGGDGATQWPGSSMTKVDTFGGYDLYKFTVPSGETNIIFNDGSTKTGDMTIQSGTVVYNNGTGQWVNATTIDEDVVVSTDPATSTTKPTTTTTSTTTATTVTQTTTISGETYYYGDVNLDNRIDIRDISVIQKYLNLLTTLNDIQKKAADVNGDGILNIRDATLVQKYAVNSVDSFPAGTTFTFAIGTTTPPTTPTTPTTTTSTTQPTTTAPSKNYLYFKNTDNWTPYAYYWSDDNIGLTSWPGVAMESVGNNVYRIEVPSEATYIIFNNNGGSQTGNLNIEGYGKIYQNGGWSNYNG